MATDRETRRRLRSLELRSQDVLLIRVLLAIVLRVVGAVLIVLAVANILGIAPYTLQPGMGVPSMLALVAAFGTPTVQIIAGLVAMIRAGTLARHLVPARVPRPRCPACGYELTTLDDGRCTECEYELTPARDGPIGSTDRLLLTRSFVATAIRIAGITIGFYGVSRFALLGITKFMLFTPSVTEQYLADRDLLWAVVLIALGITAYALADWLARIALLGVARKDKGPTPIDADPPNDQNPDLS